MPHPWHCSKPGRMRLWAAWSHGRHPCLPVILLLQGDTLKKIKVLTVTKEGKKTRGVARQTLQNTTERTHCKVDMQSWMPRHLPFLLRGISPPGSWLRAALLRGTGSPAASKRPPQKRAPVTPAISQPAPLPAIRPSSLQTAASGPPLLPQCRGQPEPALRRLLEPPARAARSTSARADARTSPLSKAQARPLQPPRLALSSEHVPVITPTWAHQHTRLISSLHSPLERAGNSQWETSARSRADRGGYSSAVGSARREVADAVWCSRGS